MAYPLTRDLFHRKRLLPPHVATDLFEQSELNEAWLHLGAGGFFRSLIADYVNDYNIRIRQALQGSPLFGKPFMGIIAVSLIHPQGPRAMEKQDCLIPLITQRKDRKRARILSSVKECIFAPNERERVIGYVSSPLTKIITLTVTGEGYCFRDLQRGGLDFGHKFIREEEKDRKRVRSAIGYLAYGLLDRMRANAGPIVIASVDNLASNSERLKFVVLELARKLDSSLEAWILKNVEFPRTMAHRITPRVDENFIALVRDYMQIEAPSVVGAGEAREFYIEHSMMDEVLAAAGIRIVDDARPFERRKAVFYNSAHLAIGVLGQFMGYDYVHTACQDPSISYLVSRLHEESAGALARSWEGPEYDEFLAYAAGAQAVFTDPIGDQLRRVAQPGSTKIPKYPLSMAKLGFEAGLVLHTPPLITAFWLMNLGGKNIHGESFELGEPKLEKISPLYDALLELIQASRPTRYLDAELDPQTVLDVVSIVVEIGKKLENRMFADVVSDIRFARLLTQALLLIDEGLEEQFGVDWILRAYFQGG